MDARKYFLSGSPQIKAIIAPSRLIEGRFAIVTSVRRDAVDAEGASDESAGSRTAKSCGPDASTLASSFAGRRCQPFGSDTPDSRSDGGKRARSPGRARSKP